MTRMTCLQFFQYWASYYREKTLTTIKMDNLTANSDAKMQDKKMSSVTFGNWNIVTSICYCKYFWQYNKYTRVTAVNAHKSQVTASGFVSSLHFLICTRVAGPLHSSLWTSKRVASGYLTMSPQSHFCTFFSCDHLCFCQVHTGDAWISCQMGGWNLEGLFLAMSVDWYGAWLRVI